jgi:hypothetical protein
MSFWKSIIKAINPKNPTNNPTHTCRGLWRFSFNLEESINPPAIIAEIRYKSNGANIFKESINTKPISAPAPTECSEIFHHKLIRVIINERTAVAKINDFRNRGIGSRKIINEVIQ